MLWIILAIAAVSDFVVMVNFIYDLIRYINYKNQLKQHPLSIMVFEFPAEEMRIAIILFLIAVVSLVVALWLKKKLRYYEKKTETKYIIAVNTERVVKGTSIGSMWHFATEITSQRTYTVYEKFKDGAYHSIDINANYTYVYEKDGTPPRVEKHISQLKYRFPVLTRFLILVKEDEESSWYYDMYVPEGSILRIYRLS